MGKLKQISPLLPGTEIGNRIIIGELLGAGTFGNVYRCTRKGKRKEYAVKIVKKRHLGPNECEILRLISNNQAESFYCMKLYKEFRYQRMHCLLMPVYGPSCFDLLAAANFGGLSISIVRDLALGIFAGLKFLADLNIIHTDIKPENVVIRREGDYRYPIIIDFGNAVYENPNNREKITTESYRAPEVEIGTQPAYGKRVPLVWNASVDVWSAGCVLFELWKGTPLFEKDEELGLIYLINDIIGPLPYTVAQRPVNSFSTAMLKDTECKNFNERQLLKIITACLTLLPSKRPGAYEVLEMLRAWEM